MAVRLAILTDLHGKQHSLKDDFSRYEGMEVVFTGHDPSSRYKEMKKDKPDVIILITDDSSFNPHDLEISLPRLQKKLKKDRMETRLIMLTELPGEHKFVKNVKSWGISVIDSSIDLPLLVDTVKRVFNGEQVEWEKTKGEYLDTYTPRFRER